MRKKISRFVALGMTVVMVFSLTACGGSSSKGTSESTGKTEETGTLETTETTDNTETEDAADTKVVANGENSTAAFEWLSEGQPEGWTEADATETVNVHLNSAAYQLDPNAASGNDANNIFRKLIWDFLLVRDEVTGGYIPWLAESYELSDDGLTVDFVIRQDAYFTNGEQVTAEDVVFSFERVRTDTEHCPDSNAKAIRNYIENAEQTGDFSCTLHFKTVNPEFISYLTSFPILCKSAYDEMGYDAYWQAPVGSGAYVLTEYDPANASGVLTMRTDEHGYWGYDFANSYSNVQTINITYAPESTTRLSSLRAGEADIISDVSNMDVEALEAEGFSVDVLRAGSCIFLQFACAEEDTFYNRDLREALSLCIDREAIVSALLGGYGIAAKTNSTEGDLGYRTDIAYEYNIEKAKELVESSGYNGEPLRFIYSTSAISIATELAQAIQSMASEAGINLEVVPLELAIYDEARNNHDFDLCLASIGKSGNMWFKVAAEVIATDRFNTGHTNEELKALGSEIGETLSQERLDELFAEMAAIELTEFEPNLYLYFPTMLYGRDAGVTDIVWHGSYQPNLTFMKVKS